MCIWMTHHDKDARAKKDGVLLVFSLVPDTDLHLYYIDKWEKRYDSDSNGSFVQEDVRFDDGFYSIYVKNHSIPNLVLDGQYQLTNNDSNGDVPVYVLDGYQEYFARSYYTFTPEFPLSLGLLFAGATFDNVAEDDVNLYGINLSSQVGPVKLSLAYTSVDDDNEFPGDWGMCPMRFCIPIC